jgi:hypothetical protein
LGGALAGIKKPEPLPQVAQQVEPVQPQPAVTPPAGNDDAPIGVVVRFNPRDHETVTEYADQLGMSLQELVETAINEKRARQGLAPIQGRPRSKTRRRRS